MKTTVRVFACLIIACGLTGCPETHVGPDFGYKPAVLKPADWNGIWHVCGDDDAVRMEVTDAAHGKITLIDLPDADDKKAKADKPSTLILRTATTDNGDKLYFATMQEQGDVSLELTPYLISRAEKDSFILWMVNNDAVAAAIKAGTLKGSVKAVKDGKDDAKSDHSYLASDPANYPLMVQPQYWDWMKPVVIMRQKK